MRIIQISDLHLSRSHAYFYDNWQVVLDYLNADPPDLVVISGDISFNGADNPADLVFARQQIQRIQAPWLVLPGNHDIGDHPHSKKLDQPINSQRLQRWLELFGQDRFEIDAAGWLILGINSELLGSGLEQEQSQYSWLRQRLKAESKPILLFSHKPLFAQTPDETEYIASCIDPQSRASLQGLWQNANMRGLASGHVHVYKHQRLDRCEYFWAPATSFIVNWDQKPVYGGSRRVGFLEYNLSPSDHALIQHRWVEPDRLINYDLQNWFKQRGSTVWLPPQTLERHATTEPN